MTTNHIFNAPSVGTVPNRGDIRVVDFECGQLFCSEFDSIRPAIIVAYSAIATGDPVTIVAPLTTKADPRRGGASILIQRTTHNCLISHIVAVAHRIRSVDNRRIGRLIGQLDIATLDAVLMAVAAHGAADQGGDVEQPFNTRAGSHPNALEGDCTCPPVSR